MDNDDKISELVSQFSADALPEEVKDIIPDFFMESVHISEQIETMGRFDYVTESVTEEGIYSLVIIIEINLFPIRTVERQQ